MGNKFALVDEFESTDLGDDRLNKRVKRFAARVERSPASSFPKLCATDAELEALYRLLRNEAVVPEKLLAPHVQATMDRCLAHEEVLVLHDSSELAFRSPREGIGRLKKSAGFLGHFSLAVAPNSDWTTHLPLGLLAFSSIHRLNPPRKLTRHERRQMPERESRRWLQGVEESQCLLSHLATAPIHVGDREADFYELLSEMVASGLRFVFRLRIDRNCIGDNGELSKVSELLKSRESVLLREVALSKRRSWKGSPTAQQRHHPREARMATLHMRAAPIEIVRPAHNTTSDLTSLRMNAIQVFEPDPPEGEEPIDWILITSEPIATVEQQSRIVDCYRARWLIEEYFKALKTGCAYEERQLESKETLLNALALLLPAAWQMLAMRTLSRSNAEAPAAELLTETQLNVLRHISERVKLSAQPTIREALLAIAGVGGHIKNNGEPGWIVIHRGMQDLLAACVGWSAAKEAANCDQS